MAQDIRIICAVVKEYGGGERNCGKRYCGRVYNRGTEAGGYVILVINEYMSIRIS
jgi:hypothetical protein